MILFINTEVEGSLPKQLVCLNLNISLFKLLLFIWGQRDYTMDRVLTLHVADPVLIPSIPYDPLSTSGETPEHHGVWPTPKNTTTKIMNTHFWAFII